MLLRRPGYAGYRGGLIEPAVIRLPFFDDIAFMYDEMRTEGNGVAPFFAVFREDVNDVDVVMVFFFRNRYGTADFRDDSVALRLTSFEQFFDTRKTLGNIAGRCDTARMEGTHRQLGTRFPDGLSSNGADRFADIDLAAGTEVAAIALRADTVTAVAGKDAADPNGIVIFCNFFRLVGHDFLIEGHDDGTRFRIDQGFSSRTAFDPFFERFDDAVAFDDGRDFYAADIVVAGLDFLDIAVQDAIDGIFRKGRTLGADFNAIGIDNGFFDGLTEHVFRHGFADSSPETFFRCAEGNRFDDVRYD